MTKLETHNINSDGQIMPNSIQNVSDKNFHNFVTFLEAFNH